MKITKMLSGGPVMEGFRKELMFALDVTRRALSDSR
jgi:hypothetical protein